VHSCEITDYVRIPDQLGVRANHARATARGQFPQLHLVHDQFPKRRLRRGEVFHASQYAQRLPAAPHGMHLIA
jgi:hypothetical protein